MSADKKSWILKLNTYKSSLDQLVISSLLSPFGLLISVIKIENASQIGLQLDHGGRKVEWLGNTGLGPYNILHYTNVVWIMI